MKILVVQLLRLGDILMTAPILSALKEKYPTAELHFLGYRDFSYVEDLFADEIHWHWLDRDALQAAVADPNKPFFHAQALLERSLDDLKKAKVDMIFNLTQNRESGWICTYLEARRSIGLHFDARGVAAFGSPWFRYLNDTPASAMPLHYIDIFRYACELETQQMRWNFRRSRLRAPWHDSPYVLIQPLTSDGKKNYPLALWQRVVKKFQSLFPDFAVGVLAGPSESERLSAVWNDRSGVHILPCSLSEALDLMGKAALLVTGDTSIKHLSCASAVPVIELSLGSSDYQKTGIYKARSLIVQGQTACAPCPHAGPCSRPTHECASQIAPEMVATAMQMMIQGAPTAAGAVGLSEKTKWLETYFARTGFWMAKDMQSGSSQTELLLAIEKSTLKLLLQREFLNPLAPIGTECLAIRNSLQERFPLSETGSVCGQLDFLESETLAADHQIADLYGSMRRLIDCPSDEGRQTECLERVRRFCERDRHQGAALANWLMSFEAGGVWPVAYNKVVHVDSWRRLQARVDELAKRTQIKLKLIRSLQLQLRDGVDGFL